MSNEPLPFLVEQLEEALEERQNSDRRKIEAELPKGDDDRRKSDRRDLPEDGEGQ